MQMIQPYVLLTLTGLGVLLMFFVRSVINHMRAQNTANAAQAEILKAFSETLSDVKKQLEIIPKLSTEISLLRVRLEHIEQNVSISQINTMQQQINHNQASGKKAWERLERLEADFDEFNQLIATLRAQFEHKQ